MSRMERCNKGPQDEISSEFHPIGPSFVGFSFIGDTKESTSDASESHFAFKEI